MKTSSIKTLVSMCVTACFAVPETSAATASDDRANILHELKLYVGKTIDLAAAGRPYQDVIAHIGEPHLGHAVLLSEDNRMGSIYPRSRLFKEIVVHLPRDVRSQHVIALEFISNSGTYNMNDLRAAFGEWHRSPKEPEECSFAIAWFPRYDASTGAPLFLYAEDGEYATRIDPQRTPVRLFVQGMIARWGE